MYQRCALAGGRCIVHFNGNIWNVQDVRHLRINHGGYYRIVVPPHSDNPPAECVDQPTDVHTVTANESSEATTFMQLSGIIGNDPLTGSTAQNIPVAIFDLQQQLCNRQVEEPIQIITWFLHPVTMRLCDEPRTLNLPPDLQQWQDALQTAWSDVAQVGVPIYFRPAHPQPWDLEEGCAGHVVIWQHDSPGMVAALLAVYDSLVNGGTPLRFATFLPQRAQSADILQATNTQGRCPPVWQQSECSVWWGTQEIPDGDWFPIRAGFSLNVVVQHFQLADDQDPWHPDEGDFPEPSSTRFVSGSLAEDDGLTLMQMSEPSSGDTLDGNGLLTVADPQREPARPMTPFVRLLHTHWMRAQQAIPDHDLPVVATWFLSSIEHRSCLKYRSVALGHDSDVWTQSLSSAWPDLIDVEVPIACYIAHPDVPTIQPPQCAHVILAQHILPHETFILLAVYDSRTTPVDVFQRAVIVDRDAVPENLYMAADLFDACVVQAMWQYWADHGEEPGTGYMMLEISESE